MLGYNMFAYCKNNPLNYADPSGNAAILTCTGEINLFIRDLSGFFGAGGGGGGGYAAAAVAGMADSIQRKKDYHFYNSNEELVLHRLEKYGVAFYKGVLVIKTPFDASFSYGFIGISKEQLDSATLKHEYGHAVQKKSMWWGKYIVNVVIPSITINLLDRQEKLPYDYYSYPWEAEANVLGNVILSQDGKDPLPQGGVYLILGFDTIVF